MNSTSMWYKHYKSEYEYVHIHFVFTGNGNLKYHITYQFPDIDCVPCSMRLAIWVWLLHDSHFDFSSENQMVI